MASPNRVRVYYWYQCGRCRRRQQRGSSAKRCEFCAGPIYRTHDKEPRVKLRIRKEQA